MSEIINLNKSRKADARGKKEKQAAENRVKFGRTKEEKLAQKLSKQKQEKLLESHKRKTDE